MTVSIRDVPERRRAAGTTRARRWRRSRRPCGRRAGSCSRTATASCTRSGGRTRLTRASRSPTCRTCCRGATIPAAAPASRTGSSPVSRRRSTRAGHARRREVCADAGTRYRRYSCVHGLGHAFMRIYGDELPPALSLCRALGPRMAPDCAQGAYHDYWFAVAGADQAALPSGASTDPRMLLCGPADGVCSSLLVPRVRTTVPRSSSSTRRSTSTSSAASSQVFSGRRVSPARP